MATPTETPTETEPTFPLLLDEQLCFSLYTASRLVTANYRTLLEDLGLTYPQYVTMLALWENAPLTVKALGEALDLDYGTLTPLIKRLESAGLVQRRRRTDDERAVDVHLTEAGRELRAKAVHIPDRIADAMGLTPAEFSRLQRDLRVLAGNLARAIG